MGDSSLESQVELTEKNMIGRLTRKSIQRQVQSQNRLYQTTSSQLFFQKLKENLREQAEKDAQFKKAMDKANQETTKLQDSFQPSIDKLKSIQDQSTPLAQQKFDEFKKTMGDIGDNEYVKKLKNTKIPGVKFTIPKVPKMNIKEYKQIQETAAAAELAGTSIFGIMDIAPTYKRPQQLRKRRPDWFDKIPIEADDATTHVGLHKDSVWNEKVEAFKTSRFGQRIADLQGRMEESDSMFVRGGKMFLWKMKETMTLNAETSHVIGVIQRVEPKWTVAEFCELLEADFLPNVLEATSLGDEDIVDDWCTEKASSVLLFNKKAAAKEGLSYQKHVYSLSGVEFLDASMDEDTDTPTIMITCSTQEIVAIIDAHGKVVDGSLDKPFQNTYVWVFGRDMNELDYRAAWRVLEVQSQAKQLSF